MRIAEYDEVDPIQVLHLNLLCLDFALTPELAAVIRRMDPRPFPCFAVYAVADRTVIGQVGIFRLPVITTVGAAEVGGVWAVATHPAYRGQGVASLLLDEAHSRMAAAGLQFSTLGTSLHGVAHALYEKHGYRDILTPARVLVHRSQLPVPAGLRAEPAGDDDLDLADRLFEQAARGYLGFARRHTPFFPFLHARGYLGAQALWLLWQGNRAVGYAVATTANPLLHIRSLLLPVGIALPAVAALVQATRALYVEARLDDPGMAAAFAQAGFQVTRQSWDVFMVKPLVASATVETFHQLYGVDSGRFLISPLDVT